MTENKKNFLENFPELNRELRGHEFYSQELQDAPDIYDTEQIDADDKVIIAHFFTGNSDWWIAEVDKDDGSAFGYTCMNGWTADAEWGYIDLPALESLVVTAGAGHVIVERDCHWTPKKFGDINVEGD